MKAENKERIGDYLVVSPAVLQNAVMKQGQALKRGEQPLPIGEILLEFGDISADELDNALRRQRSDRPLRKNDKCVVFRQQSSLNVHL